MRRFLYILDALTLIIIVAAGIGLGVFFYNGHTFDAESKAFVDRAVPALLAEGRNEPPTPAWFGR